jgi:hypothetical protein
MEGAGGPAGLEGASSNAIEYGGGTLCIESKRWRAGWISLGIAVDFQC